MVAVARGATGGVSLASQYALQNLSSSANVPLYYDLSVVQVRLGYELDTQQEVDEDIGCQSIDATESLVHHSK